MSTETSPTVSSWREQGLSATVHRACAACRAPGVFSAEERIRMDWPGCHVQDDDDRVGQPVGDRCPNCRASRGQTLIQSLGEIWRRRFT